VSSDSKSFIPLSPIHRLFKTSGNTIVQSSAMKRKGIRPVHLLPLGFLNSRALHYCYTRIGVYRYPSLASVIAELREGIEETRKSAVTTREKRAEPAAASLLHARGRAPRFNARDFSVRAYAHARRRR